MLTEELDSEPKWQSGDPYQYPIPCDGDPWQKLLKPLLERDRAQCESWKDEVHNLLIFAGLFSSVLTSFVLVSYSSLQPDQNKVIINILAHIAARLDNPLNNTLLSGAEPVVPAMLEDAIPSSSTRINIFWFTSLVLSLTAALIGIISLQWLEEHQHYQSTLSSRQKFALFNMRLEGLKAWHLPEIFSALPLLLQLALTLFFVGLIDFLFHSSSAVAIPVVAFIGIPFTFVILTTVIPALQTFGFCLPLPGKVPQQAPYKSTQSRLFRHLLIYSKHVFRLFAYVYYSLYRYIFLLPSRFRREEGPAPRGSNNRL
ncbi:hypothetical protein CPB84DRAFT_1222866 [Gymnopilus junonius]|uniref:DUF6535 domain-containing protein n=1 Tax=Gymnopilus junonius TaxID=109634 RepID=A0A9P5NZW4_GYMJU|nr:hypothetical protein CPB84DRAFT_1222866 [Gymnopilus junonius]